MSDELRFSIIMVFVGAAIAFISYNIGASVATENMTDQSNAIIETHDGIDYAVLDHDGTHYVIELGGAE